MKKYILAAAFFLCSIFVTACGAEGVNGETKSGTKEQTKEEGSKETTKEMSESIWKGDVSDENIDSLLGRTEYYDLTVKQEEIFDLGLWEKNSHEEYAFEIKVRGGTVYLPLGTQFYKGEPVQFWAESSSKGSNIYLYKKDGSGELLLEDVPNSYTTADSDCQWYIDQEGNFYCRWKKAVSVGGVYTYQGYCAKVLSSGEVLDTNKMEVDVIIEDLCQTEDGRVYLLLLNQTEQTRFLEEVDAATGLCIPESRVEVPLERIVYLGDGGDAPIVTGYDLEDTSRRVMKMNPSDGSMSLVVSFAGTSYELRTDMDLQDCRVTEDGQLEFVWTERNGTGGLLEQMKMEKVEKDTIVVRGVFWHDTWLTQKIIQFNSENSAYHVVLEDGSDIRDKDDFFRLTNVQIGAGKGPDILGGNSLPQEYVRGMLEKGALEELTPYMEASGIREEDYFPLTFATWRQGESVYAVNYKMNITGTEIEEEVLGNREIPDIETLLDAVLSLERDGVYYEGWDSGEVLNSFLQGTDSLWGMVDWESRTCDFNTPLFGKLLEAARRHGDDGGKKPESTIAHRRDFGGVAYFSGQAEQEAKGRVTAGVLFDDGCYGACLPTYTLAVNANSTNKEGAWEFICFLIGEENQSGDFTWYEPPVNRKAFEMWTPWHIYELTEVKYENGVRGYPVYYGTDVSEEKQAEYIKALEEAKPLPIRTEPIIEIILDEAKDYFNGYKNAEEISNIVGNRVQLYLDEGK